MDAPFNSLVRNTKSYTFVFGAVPAITGVLHEILPDGLLLVVGRESGTMGAYTYAINPANVMYVRAAGES